MLVAIEYLGNFGISSWRNSNTKLENIYMKYQSRTLFSVPDSIYF